MLSLSCPFDSGADYRAPLCGLSRRCRPVLINSGFSILEVPAAVGRQEVPAAIGRQEVPAAVGRQEVPAAVGRHADQSQRHDDQSHLQSTRAFRMTAKGTKTS